MRAHGDGQDVVALARPRGKHVTDFIDLDRAAQFFTLGLEPVAHALVLVRNRKPLDAALGRAAKLRGMHEGVPQALWIDFKIAAGCHNRPSYECWLNVCRQKRQVKRIMKSGFEGRPMKYPHPILCLLLLAPAAHARQLLGR